MLKTAQEVVASGDARAIVDFGIELDRTIKAEALELEEIKRVLRQMGETELADRRTEKTVQLKGHLGVATVTFPADSPKLKPGVDLAASEAGIPEDVFRQLFRKKTTIDFEVGFFDKLARLEPEDREMILDLIEVQRSTARVVWPK
jgi:hypothetical protein